MSSIGLLFPDLLREIMSRLPWDINQKFAFSHVSRYWRDMALQDHLFWSSFMCGPSKADCSRVPVALERSGSAMLNIRIRFTSGEDILDWHADALEALVPYVGRIEILDVEFSVNLNCRVLPRTGQALLNSNLEFPALQTLRLKGSEYGYPRSLRLTAPRLRNLDVQDFHCVNPNTLFSPSLENIRLDNPEGTLQTLLDIFDQCPKAWRIVCVHLDKYDFGSYEDSFFEAFTRRRPFALALRELELDVVDPEFASRIFKAGFSDVHTLTCRLYSGNIEKLAEALLPGFGPLVAFGLSGHEIQLRDEHGHIRRMQSWTTNDEFSFQEVWEYLSVHYNLHKTVREIRIAKWDDYAEIFERYPPQQPDGITLVITADWGASFCITRTMRIPGLAKLEFSADILLPVLAHLEQPAGRKVAVCIRNTDSEAFTTAMEKDAFQTAVSGDCWVLCGQCLNGRVH
ncbi:hypothetical protein K438DRAFT_1799323 [Mycena galopus ATCC 62051]|nr:hypothetical protein K438DRAFT_1799323 [Mycena galopus ATCC 62051]